MSSSDKDQATELLIQEVDEDLRREQYQQLWKRYGRYAIAGAGLIVLIVAGYQGWQTWQSKLRQEESAKFTAAQELIDEGKTADGIEALAKLGADGHTGFAIAARMRRAEILGQQGDVSGAAAAYEQIAASSAPQVFRDLVVIKLAFLTLDQADPAQLEARVAPLAALDNPWHYSATEILALIAQKKGDSKRAIELYKQLADDLQAPPGVRARAAEMLAILVPAADKVKG